MCTPRPFNSPQSEVTDSSKKTFDYVLSSPTLDYMPETPLDVNNAFMHAWQSNTFDHMPPTPDAPVHQIDHAIGTKAIVEGFEFKTRSSNKIRFDAICIHKECTWRILARKLNESNLWLLTTVEDVHTYSMTRLHHDHRNATTTVLGALLVDKVADYTRVYKPKDIQMDLNIDISYKKSWRGRKKVFDIAMGSPAESFAQLPYYCHNLILASEGTVTHIETDAEGRFKLLYVGFGVAIRGFLTLMRPLIIIDGAYLKGTYEGTNLLAVGIDDNNQIVPIATCVCQGGESTEAWSFFLSKVKESIGVVQDMTVISDQHPDAAADELTEWAAAKVHRRKLKSAKWIVDEVDKRQVYQVNDLPNVEIVDLDSHECTFRETYKELVYPLQGPSSWETPADKQNVLPPTMEKWMPRRLSKNDRFRSRGESRDKTPCGTCGKRDTRACHVRDEKRFNLSDNKRSKDIKEHIDMNPEKIAEQNQGMSKYFLFEDNELTLIEDYDDSHLYNEDTYGPTYVDPYCYYEEVDAIKEVQDIRYLIEQIRADIEELEKKKKKNDVM
ncbi:transposase, MuDR, MULE transposase domain protein [Tanacetum coccineum]